MSSAIRVAVLARAVFPLHGLGGLERSVYDLVRHLAAANVDVTLITRTPARTARCEIDKRVTLRFSIAAPRIRCLASERAASRGASSRTATSTSYTVSAQACSATRGGDPRRLRRSC